MANNFGLRKKEVSGKMRLMRGDLEIRRFYQFKTLDRRQQVMASWIDSIKKINKFNECWIHLVYDDFESLNE